MSSKFLLLAVNSTRRRAGASIGVDEGPGAGTSIGLFYDSRDSAHKYHQPLRVELYSDRYLRYLLVAH